MACGPYEVLSKNGGGEKVLVCASTFPDPGKTHSSLMCLPFPFCLLGFPPIPGLEPSKGFEEDSVVGALAAAQKLVSEDTALVDEDEEV